MNESQHLIAEQERAFSVTESPRHLIDVGRLTLRG
jgi:hypothetical protein